MLLLSIVHRHDDVFYNSWDIMVPLKVGCILCMLCRLMSCTGRPGLSSTLVQRLMRKGGCRMLSSSARRRSTYTCNCTARRAASPMG
jgi:hypothetical protein